MPCLAINLAIAKKYLENHPDENREDFILGTIAPDINMPNIKPVISIVNNIRVTRVDGLITSGSLFYIGLFQL